MLAGHGDWMSLGTADEQQTRCGGDRGGVGALTGEPQSVVGTASRGACAGGSELTCRRCMERLGLAELEHNPRNNRMRAR